MDPFLGEIRVFGFNFAPRGWAFCAGQTLPIAQNAALYSLLGTQFGGDGVRTFGLPNFQGNVAVNQGQGSGLSAYYVGQTAGASSVTLQASQLGAHGHTLNASTVNGKGQKAAGSVLCTPVVGGRGGGGPSAQLYSDNAGSTNATLDQRTIAAAGGGGSHNNMQPYVALNFCIALLGAYPPRQ